MPTPLIVLDTSVVMSALLGDESASSYGVCVFVMTGDLRLALSDALLRELQMSIRRPRILRSIRNVSRVFEIGLGLGLMGVLYHPTRRDWPSVPDPKDYWQPDLAWEAGADYIVSWDPHLTEASLPFPVEVLTPPQLLARLPTWLPS